MTGSAAGDALGDRRAIINLSSDSVAVRTVRRRRTGVPRLRRDNVRPMTGIAAAVAISLVLWAVLAQPLVWVLSKLF